MMRSHHYDGTVLFAPKSEEAYFDAYKDTFPEERFLWYTYEELAELFCFDVSSDTKEELVRRRVDPSLLPYLRRMTSPHYKSEELQRFLPLVHDLIQSGHFQIKRDPAEIFCGKVLIIRGYHSGKMLAEVLQDLPNISLNWDFPRPAFKEAPLPAVEVGDYAEAIPFLKSFLGVNNVCLRYEGKEELPEAFRHLMRFKGPFIPYGMKAIYLEEEIPQESAPSPFSKTALAELHLPSEEEKIARRLYDEQFFLTDPNLCARVRKAR